MKPLLIVPFVLLAACSGKNDVAMNKHYQEAVVAKEKARMQAIREIASQGETGAVAAAMMLQGEAGTSHRSPSSGGDKALAWAGVIVPAITSTTAVAINGAVSRVQTEASRDVALNSSNNNTSVAIDTNEAMESIAEATIVPPEVVTSTNTTNSVVCVSDGTYSCD